MKKLFISQPMRGKTPEEITAERERMISYVRNSVIDEIEVLDTYYKDFEGNRVQFLGRSVCDLGKADIAVFAPGWDDFDGCRFEHTVCETYGIPHIHAIKNPMTQEREAKILEGAIFRFGESTQIFIAIENMIKLIFELSRHRSGQGNKKLIREYLADTFIMLNQIELIFGDVSDIETEKLERLEGRVFSNE